MILGLSSTTTRVGRYLFLVSAGLVLFGVLACGGGQPQTPPTSDEGDDGLSSLQGDIVIDGSSTVFPITEAVAEEFGNLTSGKVRITVGLSGTGGGFKKFCNGETDISNASRPIKASEVQLCAEAGIDFVEVPVAIDGLTVMVNPDNDFVTCITVEDLQKIWSAEAEGNISRWNQVRPEWPDETIHLFGPGVDSGTFDYFTETINGEAQSSRGDFTASEDDNVLVQGIYGTQNSLGYFGYSYFTENKDKLKSLAIDGGSGCVAPNDATINEGTYVPLSRPLFIYVSTVALQQLQVKEFIRYYVGAEGQALAAEVGYVPFQDKVYQLVSQRIEAQTAGTIFGGENPSKGSVEQVLEMAQ